MSEVPVVSEVERIAEQLQRAFAGGAWHGPSLEELLRDVTAAEASARPIANSHSIWEITHHLITWHRVAGRRLQGEAIDPSPEEDWPAVSDVSDAAWQGAHAALRESLATLHAQIQDIPEARLEALVPGKPYSFYTLLHGVVQHDLYHAGQITLLKNAIRS